MLGRVFSHVAIETTVRATSKEKTRSIPDVKMGNSAEEDMNDGGGRGKEARRPRDSTWPNNSGSYDMRP